MADSMMDSAAASAASANSTPAANSDTEQMAAVGATPQPVHVDVEVNRLRIPSVVMATAGVLFVLLMAWVLYRTLNLFLLLFLALLIATAIEPVVNWLRRGPFNRSAGILVVYTGIFGLLALIGWITVPIILQQIGELGSSLSRTLTEAGKSVDTLQSPFAKQQGKFLIGVLQSVVNQFQTPPPAPQAGGTVDAKAVESATQTALIVAEVFLGFITIFVVAFYWLTERTLIKRALMSWLPARRANRVRRVWDDIEVKVGGWVRGQLTLMAIVGVVSAIGYLVLGIDYWPALGLFIAIAEAIPLVGPYIGTAPAILVALTQPDNDGGFGKAMMVVLFAIVLQMIEGNVLVPRVMKNSVGISPLTVILSILFGATLAGLAGALVAVPIAGSLQVIISDIKAAHESEEKLEEVTAASQETRAEAGELVVASQAGNETKTQVKAEAGAKV